MTSIKKEKNSNTKEVILKAAEAEFLEHGFHGTTTAAIAKKAGVNHAMLHYYFGTKENLFEMFISSKMQDMKNIIFPAMLIEGQGFIDRIKTVIERQFDYAVEHPSLPKFMLNEVLTKPERFKQLITSVLMSDIASFNSVKTELESEIKQGRIRPITLVDLILDIISLNIMCVVMKPMVGALSVLDMDEARFIELRKKEIIEVITSRLINK